MNYKYLLFLCLFISPISFSDDTLLPDKNTLVYALTEGTLKGLIRYNGQYRNSDLHLLQDGTSSDTTNEKKQQYSSMGGYIGYETAPLYYLSIGATLYTSQPTGNNPDDRKGLGGLYEKNGGQGAYTVFGEAYLKFEKDGHLIKAGRQEMPNYRFVSLSDIRMTPLTHEGAIYENTVFDHWQLNLAYITKMKERNSETFIDMAEASRIKTHNNGKKLIRGSYNPSDYDEKGYTGDNKEMTMAGLLYSTDQFSVEGWNYYVDDLVNTLYLYGQYNITPKNSAIALNLSAQYAKQDDVGDSIAGNIDSYFYGLKLQATMNNTQLFVSFNEVDYNENSYDGGTIFVRWGSPQMFNSFQVQDSELAGTISYGVGVQYQFDHKSIIPLPGLAMRLRYGDYNLPDRPSKIDARQDRTETTFDINYAFSKDATLGNISLAGLSLQFRVAYNDYKTNYDFEKYVDPSSITSVTDSFTDTRLYLNYKF